MNDRDTPAPSPICETPHGTDDSAPLPETSGHWARRHGLSGGCAWPSLLAALVSAFTGCEPAASSPAENPETGSNRGSAPVEFRDVFHLEREIRLEEGDTAVITRIDWLAVSDDGRLAIPDAMESQARVFDPDGRLLANLGRRGEGPGEFRRPRFTAFADDGSLYVADSNLPRITRFTPSFALDTMFALPEAQKLHGLVTVNGGFAVGHIRAISSATGFAGVRDSGVVNVYDTMGRRTASFYRLPDPVFDVPYWLSAVLNMGTSGFLLTARDERVVVGTSLLFPLVEFTTDGNVIDSIGGQPPSWIEASRPERGAFRPPNQMAKFQPWMRSFTTIHRAVIMDRGSVLVVHRSLDPDVLAYEEASYRADLYDADGMKVWEDVALPGDLLTGVGRKAYVLTAGAPESWTLSVYTLTK